MRRILSPTLDFVFKLIFGDQRNSDILADFLKAALKLPPEEYDHLVIVDPHLKREAEDDKLGILDVKLHTKSGIVINVEVQMASSTELRDRIVLYGAKMLTEQVKRGDTWDRAEQVISIIIIDDILLPEEDGYYNEYALCNRKNGKPFTELLGLNILELPKLPVESDGSRLWYWGRFFTSQDEEEFTMVAEKEPGVRKAVATLMELSEDERNRMLADARDRWVSDQMALRKDSYRKGLAEGREEGQELKMLEIARKMKQAGQPPEQIMAFTGLSQEKINLL